MRNIINEWSNYLSCLVIVSQYATFATIDVNLNELEYLAARLDPFECRRLIAALHYTTYELPNSLAAAERRVDDETSCIGLLLHWNSFPAEGRGKTHEAIVHRLRQINRNDLADWLGKSAFKQLGKDLDRAIVKPFDSLGAKETEPPYTMTLEPMESKDEEDPWFEVHTVLMAILLGLLGTLLTLICASILYRIKSYFRKPKYRCSSYNINNHNSSMFSNSKRPLMNYRKLEERTTESENEETDERRRRKVKYRTESSSEITDNTRTETETDTDFG